MWPSTINDVALRLFLSLVAFLYLYMRSTWSSHFFDQYMAYLIRPDTCTFESQQRTWLVTYVLHIYSNLSFQQIWIFYFLICLACIWTTLPGRSIPFFVLVHPSIRACVILLQMSNVRASCRYMQLACRSWILIYPFNLFPSKYIKQYLLIGNGYRSGFKNWCQQANMLYYLVFDIFGRSLSFQSKLTKFWC